MPGISRNNDTAGGDLVPSQGTVFVNNQLVGGFTELKTYLEQTAGGFGKGQI